MFGPCAEENRVWAIGRLKRLGPEDTNESHSRGVPNDQSTLRWSYYGCGAGDIAGHKDKKLDTALRD